VTITCDGGTSGQWSEQVDEVQLLASCPTGIAKSHRPLQANELLSKSPTLYVCICMQLSCSWSQVTLGRLT
jgi:hypothetical protein